MLCMKDLVEVDYMPEGCNDRAKELQAWINFGDFLDEYDGEFCLAITWYPFTAGQTPCTVSDVLMFFY